MANQIHRFPMDVVEERLQVREIVRKPVAVGSAPLGEAIPAPVRRVHIPILLERVDQELERSRHVHPAVQEHHFGRAGRWPAPNVVAQAADPEVLRYAGLHVMGNATAGHRPEIKSAMSAAEPHASVQPSVPCPVFIYRLGNRVRPITGTLLGVAGRKRATPTTPAPRTMIFTGL